MTLAAWSTTPMAYMNMPPGSKGLKVLEQGNSEKQPESNSIAFNISFVKRQKEKKRVNKAFMKTGIYNRP